MADTLFSGGLFGSTTLPTISGGQALSNNAGSIAAASAAGVDVTKNPYNVPTAPVPANTQTVDELLLTAQTAEQQYADAQSATAEYTGDIQEENAYNSAEAIANQNARLTTVSTAIQAAQQDRATAKALGTQTAEVAGAGLGGGGTAASLFRESAYQGALAKSLIQTQGAETEAGYSQQAVAAASEAAAVGAAATVAQQFQQTALTDYQNTKTNALNYAMLLSQGATASSGGVTPVSGGLSMGPLSAPGSTTPGPYSNIINSVTSTLNNLGKAA